MRSIDTWSTIAPSTNWISPTIWGFVSSTKFFYLQKRYIHVKMECKISVPVNLHFIWWSRPYWESMTLSTTTHFCHFPPNLNMNGCPEQNWVAIATAWDGFDLEFFLIYFQLFFTIAQHYILMWKSSIADDICALFAHSPGYVRISKNCHKHWWSWLVHRLFYTCKIVFSKILDKIKSFQSKRDI